MGDQNLVTEPNGGQVPQGTLDTGSVPQGGTLPNGSADVEKKVQEIANKYEKDIAALKSTFQRSEYQLQQQVKQQKEEYDKYVRDLKLKSMDDSERKKFEEQELIERNRNYEAEAQEAKRKLVEREQRDQYRDFFLSVGINPAELDQSGDLTAFVNSGYAVWAKKTKNLEKKLAELEKKSQGGGEDLPAPDVDTTRGKPGRGSTWQALIKEYGSAEKVYRLIENGHLPASILPEV